MKDGPVARAYRTCAISNSPTVFKEWVFNAPGGVETDRLKSHCLGTSAHYSLTEFQGAVLCRRSQKSEKCGTRCNQTPETPEEGKYVSVEGEGG